jgi:hypothetical protein
VRQWNSRDGWYGKTRWPEALPLEPRLEHDAADLSRHLSATVRSERMFSGGQRKLPGANSAPGMGHGVEDRTAFLRKPGEPNAR